MEKLIFVRPGAEYADEIRAYRQESLAADKNIHGSSGLQNYRDPIRWIESCRLFTSRETLPSKNFVESDQYMLVREGEGRVLGMLNLRRYLDGNELLKEFGGHIGYSVRPSERKKGYAKKMLALGLDKCRELGLDKVLLTCKASNEASRRTILALGGVYERTVFYPQEQCDMERYWISLYPVSDYYRNNDEDGRLVRSKHRTVEFLTTMRYIERYIKTGDKVIEIGAGTGRYSLALADRGYRVDAVELVDHNIEIFKSKIKPGHEVTIRQGNALDLSFAADNSYDITLLLGPMYHLFTFGDKQRALSEALRVTKKGGPVFAAYCIADMSIFGYGFQGGNIHRLIEMGLIDTQTFKAKSTAREVFELHRKEDIDALMQGLPARRLHYAATDLYTLSMGEAVDAMDDETFALYLKYHYSICERPDMVGLTHHSLDVFRKL